MTPAELDSLEEVARAATPGPWAAEFVFGSRDLPLSVSSECGSQIVHITEDCSKQPSHDVRHIATFDPPSCLALLAEIRRLRGALEFYQARSKSGDVHSCHRECTRTACVLRRENQKLRSVIEEILKSDMAQREEDEGMMSSVLHAAREALGVRDE